MKIASRFERMATLLMVQNAVRSRHDLTVGADTSSAAPHPDDEVRFVK